MQINDCNSQFPSVPPIPSLCHVPSHRLGIQILTCTDLSRVLMLVRTARMCYNLVTVLRDIIPTSHCCEMETMSWKYARCLVSKFPSKGTLQILTFLINLNLRNRKTVAQCLFGTLTCSFPWVSKLEADCAGTQR